jgi:hypothetical protein
MAPRPAGLYVAIYRPLGNSNYAHWDLYLDAEDDDIILQMAGQHPNFTFQQRSADPEKSSSLRKLIHVSDVAAADVDQLIEIAKEMEIDNENPSWDCQEWVIDVLEKLVEECVIGYFDDYDNEDEEKKFRRTIKKIKNLRGPDDDDD